MKELRAPKPASEPVLGTLSLAGRQPLLDGKSCKLEIHPALAGLGSAFAASTLDEALEVCRSHPALLEAVRQTPVLLTPSATKLTYWIIGGLRSYLLLRELEPQGLSMSTLVLPRLAGEALAPYLLNELFTAPLLLVLFNNGASARPAEGGARRHHRGNVTRTLIKALESPFNGGPPLRQQLGLISADLSALGLEVHYHRAELQKTGAPPASSEEKPPEARLPSAAPNQEEEKELTNPPEDEPAPQPVGPWEDLPLFQWRRAC